MKILITFFCGVLAVLLTGMLFYRLDIFNIHSPNFQFISAGIIASALYPVALYREKREFGYIAALLTFIHMVIFRLANLQFIVRDLIYLLTIILSVWIYSDKVLPVIRKIKAAKIFGLPFVFGLFFITASLLLALENYLFFGTRIPDLFGLVLFYLKYGAMIGFGLSVGFNFAELIIKSYLE